MLEVLHDFFARLEPHVAAPARSLAALYPAPALRVSELFFTYFILSLCFCGVIFVASRSCTSAFVGKSYAALLPSDRRTWHTNMVTFWPAFAVTAFALPAVRTFDGSLTSFSSQASAYTIKACGMSIGYMTWDLGVMLMNWSDQCLAYGGEGPMYLFIVHHILSMILWPYALTRGLCAYHINWFLISECTNFNMSLRWYMVKLNMTKSKVYLLNGLSWIPLFLGVRVLVIPSLFKSYWYSDWSVFTPEQVWIARVTLPIPSLLNVYWARQIVQGAVQFLVTGEDPEKKAAPVAATKAVKKTVNNKSKKAK